MICSDGTRSWRSMPLIIASPIMPAPITAMRRSRIITIPPIANCKLLIATEQYRQFAIYNLQFLVALCAWHRESRAKDADFLGHSAQGRLVFNMRDDLVDQRGDALHLG